jgi:hypothetical protein
MEAKYFLERLINYDHEVATVYNHKHYYYGYDNGTVTIHNVGRDSVHYILWRDGTVQVRNNHDYAVKGKCKIEDLAGNFELYSNVQYFKCGYLIFKDTTFNDIKLIISNTSNYIETLEYEAQNDPGKGSNTVPLLCGSSYWNNGLTEHFTFLSCNKVEITLNTIPYICRDNYNRRLFDAKCLPFQKEISKDNGIYVTFTHFISSGTREEILEKCNYALKELQSYITKGKWVDMNISKPIYH